MISSATFFQHRKFGANQAFPAYGEGNSFNPKFRTIMIPSHVWWSDLIGLAFINLGYNVIFTYPWYILYTDDEAWSTFDKLYDEWTKTIHEAKVDLILGGNTTAMVMHPKTKEMLHNAGGVPIVNYWWDEVRTPPPCMTRNPKDGSPLFNYDDYIAMLQAPQTLNVIWDRDVMEELAVYSGITNTVHVPLGTTPDFWPQLTVPMKLRPVLINFLGNCHYDAGGIETDESALAVWARHVAAVKLADPVRPMVDIIKSQPMPEINGDPWQHYQPWRYLSNVLMHRARNTMVQAMVKHTPGKNLLIGKNWDKFGLTALAEHSGVPKAGEFYAGSKMSLNLAGGCVHGGLPLRPYEIACSNGLILAHHTRELGEHFDIGQECLAFRTAEELCEHIDRVSADPEPYEKMIVAGKRRTITNHTWEHRARAIIEHAREKLKLAW